MADDVEMIPVEASEPPKANPPTVSPVANKPTIGGTPTAALKPGLRLPPKPGLAAGLKLPPKPAAAAPAPGMKLPTVALKPGIKLPPKPVIRKPGSTVTAVPLPKPVAPLVAAAPAAAAPAPAAPAAPAAAAPAASAAKPMETLKSVTQKLKGITQQIPQQAILRKTGIIADAAMTDAQKEAAKHKTARISLSDAMGVAPVKDEHAPMKTIRIKRPVDISGATKPAAPAAAPAAEPASAPAAETQPAATDDASSTITQRKTLKISRPGGAVRPTGKFGVKRPGQPTAGAPAEPQAGEPPVADIADIPEMPTFRPPAPLATASENSAMTVVSAIVQVAACLAIGLVAWKLFQNTQIVYF